MGASLANQQIFLVLARAFENIGVSTYSGGANLLSGSPYLMTAARILAVEGQQREISGWKSPVLAFQHFRSMAPM